MVWILWNREQIWIHILTNALLTALTISLTSLLVAFYSMEITFAIYLSLYIKSLQNNLISKTIGNKEIYEQHKEIIELINDYNEVVSGQLYLETLITPIVPCGYGLAGIRAIQKNDFSQSFDNTIRSILSLLPCIVSCSCGQVIITQMERLHDASYMSNWYEQKIAIRKDLLMLMINTTKPTSINYRLFARFDNVLLSAVLQVIYSYFTLMLNMDQQ
ncbi:hypothetical protein O3M35_002677 [Rhynocoris fuscipes]|uniref:Uncharacterized protein n=1 Tax=Rhynocoris fuscipes TaxID=488301 RepID=A0AAW1CNN2_9HEMI